jgi:dihydrofolate synthase/folylpolyglutamate synthase
MTYSQAIQFLYSLRWFGTKLGLSNTLKLAELAGNPHHQLRFIHVAGTNGKGSTCAMLESIYRAAGLRVGLFTSPHLVAFGERIQVNRQLISESDIIRLVEQMLPLLQSSWGPLKSINPIIHQSDNPPIHSVSSTPALQHSNTPSAHPTFFEVVTVMALRYFVEQKCDLVIWETGLGGRLDATNIVSPLASVITNVQYDHQKWLGETLSSIAAEKAGIIKPAIPIITATDEPEALKVIQNTARTHNSPLTVIRSPQNSLIKNPEGIPPQSPGLPSLRGYPGFEVDVVSNPERVAPFADDSTLHASKEDIFRRDSSLDPLRTIDLPLLGTHQRLNAALAISTIRILSPQIPVTDESIHAGLSQVHWPGRLQLITRQSGQKILLDGAHNIAGAQVLANSLTQYFPGTKPTLILGILQDKDWEAICRILAPLASRILLVPVPSDRTANPDELSTACQCANPEISIHPSASLAAALSETTSDPFLLITGSLYLVGEALELLQLSPTKHHDERGLNEWSAIPTHQSTNPSIH